VFISLDTHLPREKLVSNTHEVKRENPYSPSSNPFVDCPVSYVWVFIVETALEHGRVSARKQFYGNKEINKVLPPPCHQSNYVSKRCCKFYIIVVAGLIMFVLLSTQGDFFVRLIQLIKSN